MVKDKFYQKRVVEQKCAWPRCRARMGCSNYTACHQILCEAHRDKNLSSETIMEAREIFKNKIDEIRRQAENDVRSLDAYMSQLCRHCEHSKFSYHSDPSGNRGFTECHVCGYQW